MPPLRYISGVKSLSKLSRPSTPTPSSSSRAPPPAPPPPSTSQDQDRRIGEYSSAEDVCPVCRTDRYLNPKLRLMVSSCYHKMCESCVDRIFSLGPEPCPICATTIRKQAFRPQIFENLGVQKEVSVRSRIARIFNRREDEFPSLEAYNNYLEESESAIFALTTSSDAAWVEDQLRAYEQQHRAQIERTTLAEEEEKRALGEREEEERRRKEIAREGWERLDEEERRAKEEERKRVLESLESSEASASSILSAAKKSSRLRSSARAALTSTTALPLPFFPSAPLPPVASASASSEDPEPAFDFYETLFELPERGYAAFGGEGGEGKEEGGWRREDGWERAVREAVMGLWVPPLAGARMVVE